MSDQYPRAPKLPKPMSDERLAEIRRAWFEEERIRTHYHGCYLAHAECALNVALAEVDRRGDELRSLRALLGVMHPEIVAVAATDRCLGGREPRTRRGTSGHPRPRG